MGERVVTVNDVLDGHTVLDLSCLDRLYLSGFVQRLQTPAGSCTSCTSTAACRSRRRRAR